MASIYEKALGEDFQKLHPRIQERFGFDSKDRKASLGRGVMDRIWYSKLAALPLYVGTLRHIMFPQSGEGVPFSIANYAYRDSFGRETVTWCREFRFDNAIRKFDATMIYSDKRQAIVDYLGNKQHLAVDLRMRVSEKGGIRIRSGDQRFYEGLLQFHFPKALTGMAEVHEWYDDREDTYKISVEVTNPLLGHVFRYQGRFQARFVVHNEDEIPLHVRPLREECRE
jgi:hypothetical protein